MQTRITGMSGRSTSGSSRGSTSGTIPARGELRACRYMNILTIYGIITYVISYRVCYSWCDTDVTSDHERVLSMAS